MPEQKLSKLEITEFCERHWHIAPDEITYPGGEGRKTVLVKIRGRSFALSKRRSDGRAELEALVLDRLGPSKLVPPLVVRDKDFVVQGVIEGERLTQSLESASKESRKRQLIQAGKTLLELQNSGEKAGLLSVVPQIGQRAGWMEDFVRTPTRLADFISLELSGFDEMSVLAVIKRRVPAFVKWDARPGNAMTTEDGQIVWFDWEHCGCGSVEDDLVWLLADEWTPICQEAEQKLLSLAARSKNLSVDELIHRFRMKAVLHSLIRLLLILERKGDGPWWSVQSSMKYDRVGVSLPHVNRVCRRAMGWIEETPELHGLAPLIRAIGDHAARLPV
ncbi:MAG: phosphotransferase [Rhodobacteraceae bacterium]|nr:phosphotransferase [Paracoccaceae bacterium]